ncbi:nucleotidyltransferase [uncultured Photobacterium sp.]|uniref:nucleotidyltransferase domain-containing protein n=1 Tax=uncultured Photobacterium sp. TaxID=173973 RepID=UPI002618DE00|nr:nucleotidyltransferase [uncultured Photobacterium sp.]
MPQSKYSTLVENALQHRDNSLRKGLESISEGISMESFDSAYKIYGPWARELAYVNDHITVPQDIIDNAAKEYEKVASKLIKELEWDENAIRVLPQGSASTQTLIKAPDRSKFDIDAVCQVDVSQIDAQDPMAFFEKVGDVLAEIEAIRKKRCWNIPFSNEPFYLEFTPSIPLVTVTEEIRQSMSPRFLPVQHQYLNTALAVVDTPTESWKTSNPEGFSTWVKDTAELKLLVHQLNESFSIESRDGIAPVPEQHVELEDTLRIAIRLFKRHRDMCVRRGQIEKESKPISVIIVTLLTGCYAGLSNLGQTYHHPIELLADLVELMPKMIEVRNGEFWVENPTVPEENFAERWNEDDGERFNTITRWCALLAADLQHILRAKDDSEIKERVRKIFGCQGSKFDSDGSQDPGYDISPILRPKPAPKTNGLA